MPHTVLDTLEFSVKAETVLVNDTVKLLAQITALVAGDVTEEALRADIRETMQKFIATEWQFANLSRSADPTGFERVTLTASARVSEKENYNLDGRARAASRKGLQIASVQADTSIPAAKIEEAERKLRADIMVKVQNERAALNKLLGDSEQPYRLHRIAFGALHDGTSRHARAGMMLEAATTKSAYGSGFGGDDQTLGNASKLTMTAEIILGRAG